jgi:hypothetical protein
MFFLSGAGIIPLSGLEPTLAVGQSPFSSVPQNRKLCHAAPLRARLPKSQIPCGPFRFSRKICA